MDAIGYLLFHDETAGVVRACKRSPFSAPFTDSGPSAAGNWFPYIDFYHYRIFVWTFVHLSVWRNADKWLMASDIVPLKTCTIRGETFPCPREADQKEVFWVSTCFPNFALGRISSSLFFSSGCGARKRDREKARQEFTASSKSCGNKTFF